MVLGKVLAIAGMEKGFNVTWFPSYGAEVRGGTAHCMVHISSDQISSPVVFSATTAVVMNTPSLDKFEEKVVKGGLIIVNESMVERDVKRKDLEVIKSPLTDEAIKIGNVRVANMIAVGIYAAKKNIIDRETLVNVIEKMAGNRKELIPINVKALDRGIEIAGGVK